MPRFAKLSAAAVTLAGAVTMAQGALAGNVSSASDYNSPYGMTSGQENQSIDPSLRDGNGNLTMVNGVFTSSNMGQSTFQQMSSLGAVSSGSTLTTGGVGFGNSNVAAAQAVGNSLNVVTVGTGNTVIVNSHQTNNGDQTATVTTNGN
jgi:holdfast attachment protein HfaA